MEGFAKNRSICCAKNEGRIEGLNIDISLYNDRVMDGIRVNRCEEFQRTDSQQSADITSRTFARCLLLYMPTLAFLPVMLCHTHSLPYDIALFFPHSFPLPLNKSLSYDILALFILLSILGVIRSYIDSQ